MAKESKSKVDGNEIISRADYSFSSEERVNAEKVWRDLAKYIVPSENGGFQHFINTKGSQSNKDVYDSTAQMACRDLASAMQSTITNPTTKWHRFRFRDELLNNLDEGMAWLDHANSEIFYALTESNFNSQIGRSYQSGSGLGTFVLSCDEKQKYGQYDGLNFVAIPMGEVAMEENHLGVVDVFHRKFCMTAKKLVEKFGQQAVGDDVMRAFKEKPNEEFEVYHSIYPRDESIVRYNSLGGANPLERPFASCYVLAKGAKVLKESGYYECPAFASRWMTLPGEVYGIGPGHIARADIMTLNTLVKDTLTGLARAVKPTWAIAENNLLTGDLRPNKLVVMRDITQFKEMTTSARFDVSFLEQKELRDAIKSAFYIDKLMLPPRTQTGEMTAYEIQQRLEQMQVILGPVLSNMNSEFLSPLIMRILKILMRNGRIRPIPQSVTRRSKNYDQSGQQYVDLDIMYLNQLARSQQLADLRNIQSFAQEVAGLAQSLGPQAVDKINVDAVVDETARIRNIPESIINSDQEVEEVRQNRAQQTQQSQDLQQGEQLGKIIKDVSAAQPGTVK